MRWISVASGLRESLNNLKKITSSSDQQDPIFSVNNKEWSYKEWDNKCCRA